MEDKNLVNSLVDQISKQIIESAKKQVSDDVKRQLAQIDLRKLVDDFVSVKLDSLIRLTTFPENSINHTAINFSGLVLNGDVLKGGIIENFGSTGIEDRASTVKLTIMDHASVFEGPIIAPSADIKGTLTVEGDLVLRGEIPSDSNGFKKIVEHSVKHVQANLNQELFQSYSDIIAKNIFENGIDLNKITQDGKEVITGNKLGYHITDTNIQRLGTVTDLQTKGEALLSGTLYTTSGRVGINTMDPSSTFVVWDEEVEMIVTKRKQDVGYIGTPRRQALVIGSNNKENIILDIDGSVQIEELLVGRTRMVSSNAVPNYEGQRGDIVWNEEPSVDSYIGWVCVNGSQWAGFGKIE
jgi:hypothetical protein